MWILFAVLCLACLVLAILFFSRRGPRVSSAQAPEVWDERSINRHLGDLRGQPPSVAQHYVESVLSRIVSNENDKTALAQLKFLKTKVEELRLFKEGQHIVIDLEALGLEREKRLKTLQLENAQLDDTIRTRSNRERLIAEKEQKEIERDIARIEKEIAELNSTGKRESELTPEQKHAKEKTDCETRIAKLKAQKKEALLIEDTEERVRTLNAIDTALQREYQRWSGLL